MSTIIRVVKNNQHTRGPRSGKAAYAKAVRRYDLKTEALVGSKGVVHLKAADGSTHEVPAENIQNDLEYVVPVTIGTPGVELVLDFDTGSSDLWVWSSELKASVSTLSGHTIYDPTKSSTSARVSHGSWKISYGDGSSASGDIVTDVVKIGDITIPQQGVELATSLSQSFLTEGGSDGLLGLAWPSINTAKPQQKTPVQNIIEGGLVPQGVFTSLLKPSQEGTGFYSFGTIPVEDAGVNESSISYVDVDNSNGFWQFDSTSVVVNGKTISLEGNSAIADTGTTLVLLSNEVVKAIYHSIHGARFDHTQGGYVYPADATVPTVQVAVGQQLYTIPADHFGYGAPDSNNFVFGGIQSRGTGEFDILGDVFLKGVFVVWDQQNARLGVAQRDD